MTRELLNPSYTKRDFQSIQSELKAFIQTTYPQVQTDFHDSTLMVALLEMIALVGDKVAMGQDVAALEVFLSTARRYESALRFAQSVGYKPKAARSAQALLTIDPLPELVQTEGGVIEAGQTIQGPNQLTYTLMETVRIPAGQTFTEFVVVEGELREETSLAAEDSFHEVETLDSAVAEGTLEVYVGDADDPANRWREVASLALQPVPDFVYETELLEDGRLLVRFGDGNVGVVPNQPITLRYRVTAGPAGNLAADVLFGVFDIETLESSEVIRATAVNTDAPAQGGERRESRDALKANVPAFLRSADRIITLDDYTDYAKQVAGVSQALARPQETLLAGNVVEVNVWGREVVEFTSESPDSGRQSTVEYDRYAVLDASRLSDLHVFFRPRTLLTAQTVFEQRDVAWVDLYLSSVLYDARFTASEVHRLVTEAVVREFERGDGFTVAVSDVYNAIDSLRAVRNFHIDRVVFERQEPGFAQAVVGFVGVGVSPLGAFIEVGDGDVTVKFEVAEFGGVLDDPTATPIYHHTNPGDPATASVLAKNLREALIAVLQVSASVQFDIDGNLSVFMRHTKPGDGNDLSITTGNGWSLTLNPFTILSQGDDTIAVRRTDHRRDMLPDEDEWQPGEDYVPGAPFVDGAGPWVDDGIVPYERIRNLRVGFLRTQRNFYNGQFLYNAEIRYDSLEGAGVPPQVINLRRLVFELTPDL